MGGQHGTRQRARLHALRVERERRKRSREDSLDFMLGVAMIVGVLVLCALAVIIPWP